MVSEDINEYSEYTYDDSGCSNEQTGFGFTTCNSARYNHALWVLYRLNLDFVINLSAPTCCQEWNVGDVLQHVATVSEMVFNVGLPYTDKSGFERKPELLHQAQREHYRDIPEYGANEIAKEVILRCMKQGPDRFRDMDFLESLIQTPFGEMTVDNFLGVIWVDTLTHAWDIADACNINHSIPQVMAEEAYKVLVPRERGLRGPGLFNPAVKTTSQDAVDRFIAFTGRKSVRD